ncbi:glycosyltransferase [Vibrio profundi]|uniref:glycosyltransferase n=1 Tax=Vibrio profundi TaxID=1774960 RepID=UPI003736CE9A
MKKNILYVHYGDNWIRGSEICLINLMESLDRNRFSPILWTNCIPLLRHVQAQGVETEFSDFPLIAGWLAPRFDFLGWWRLVKQAIAIIRTHKIDAIHVNSGAPCQWMCLAARLCQIPLVTQLHSDYQLRDRFTLGLHMSPHIICVSHAISQGIIDDGYPKAKLDVIHNGVKESHHQSICIREYFEIPSHSAVLISVGSLIVRKGYDLIIQALQHLEADIEVHLVIVGDGEEHNNLQQLTQSLGLTDRVHFAGERHNVSDWLEGGADAYVSGARDEAFGLTIAEAGLAQLPVVVPNVGGIPEFITHNETGLLYSPDNAIIELGNAISQIVSDSALRQRLAQNLYLHASCHLTVAANTKSIQSVYDKISAEPTSHTVPVTNGFKPLIRWAFK